ncbi:N-terminal acetyltransferase B complex auxiliary subunit NAA25-like isoform X2 [Durio zibethinus]|uniref:N-terminal acetyltransferase B complex auxiliary subunit NAA25-like isoform X2 n=1 Tax=Durio zibethinus TaxID=66656 RepID=A0A6P5XLZ9_DURZI|nr:N-terminal acetyltransferase B complex auxiliary subunit NAA25-like isoform X2 [Durio zibethinus]
MASKFGLAGGIPERRVRPIWDAIDSRQFKTALKITTTLLSKHPHSPYALALKALILERMGKSDEALSVCLNAKELLCRDESLLMDDLTLSTLQIVFQRLDHLDLATSCYEHACGKFPNNLELMMGLFNCYVREYSFVKQQQVLCGNGGEKLLLLAEGLLKKHVASHSLHEPEALIVYFSILEQQEKYSDALEILTGKLGSLLMIEVDKLRIQGKLLARAGDYATAANVYQKILELCADDWEAFLHYLGCLFEDDSCWSNETINAPIHPPKFVECKLTHLTDEVFDSRISNASAFVQKLRAEASNDSLRNPYLAHLEIERRKFLFGKNNDDDLIEALLQYYSRFGHLACFTSDVEAFLQVVSPEKKMEFLDKLMKNSNSLSAVPTKALGQSITLLKTQELIGNMFRLSVGELEGSAVQMAELYRKNLPLSKELDPQESMHGEELLSIVCNVLVQLFWRTRNLGYFVEAIMVLEFGLTIRRYVWQYKILLLHLYSHFGALSLAYERYKSLDVKNILMETVSHHMLPQMLASPLWADLSNLIKDYLKFMDDHFRESADLTFLAYRHRNYSKVIEFVQFKERLQHSNQYLVARVESPILQLKQSADNIEEEESILESLKCGIDFVELSNEIGSKSLTFNEDFQSRPWWTPTKEKNYLLGPFEGISYYPKENLTKEREANVRGIVERKSLLPRMIYLSIQSASVLQKDSSEINGSLADPKISSELKTLLERYAKMLGFSLNDAVDVVVGVSHGLKSYEAFGSDIIDWLNFAVFFNAWNLNSHEFGQHGGECTPGSWHLVNSLLESYILGKVRSMEPLIQSPQGDLPILVQLVTEPLAWHGLVIQSCVRSCLPSGKKKKKSGSMDQSLSLLTHAIRDAIQSLCGILEEVAKWSQDQINSPEDNKIDILVSPLRRNGQDEGPGQVFHIFETLVSSPNETELGNRISQALRDWSPVDVARKIVSGQCTVLSEFWRICESKIKSLKTLKQQIAQV